MLELRFFFLMEVVYVRSLNIRLGIIEQRVMPHSEKNGVSAHVCVYLYIHTHKCSKFNIRIQNAL